MLTMDFGRMGRAILEIENGVDVAYHELAVWLDVSEVRWDERG